MIPRFVSPGRLARSLILVLSLIALPSRADDRASYFERHARLLAQRGDRPGAAVIRELGSIGRSVPRSLSAEAAARQPELAERYESFRKLLAALVFDTSLAPSLSWRIDRAEAALHFSSYGLEHSSFPSREIRNALNDAAWILGGLPRPAPRANHPEPEILLFAASRDRIVGGETVIIRWRVENADAARLDGRDVGVSGERIDQPAATSYYRLEAQGPGGRAEAGLFVSVMPRGRPAQPRVTLSADPPVIYRGDTVLLSWRAVNAGTLRLDGRAVPTEGREIARPSATTRYTIEAEGPGGRSATTVEVVMLVPRPTPVVPMPAPAAAAPVVETPAVARPNRAAVTWTQGHGGVESSRRDTATPVENAETSPYTFDHSHYVPNYFPENNFIITLDSTLWDTVIVPANGERITVPTHLRRALDNQAALLEWMPNSRLRITGHTDDVGTETANVVLSLRRAQAARRDFSRRYGIPESRIEVVGRGESEPLVPNLRADGRPDPRARRQNRRVEFLIVR